MQKTALGKNHFSQPWRGHFPRSNSRSTSTDPNISSGVFIISFGSWEGSQKSPKDEVHFQKCGIFYCVESSFSNDDSERMEYHFEKRSKDFVPNTSYII
jgi:hypothetical protein